jgi:hypothetical protein
VTIHVLSEEIPVQLPRRPCRYSRAAGSFNPHACSTLTAMKSVSADATFCTSSPHAEIEAWSAKLPGRT